MAETTDPKKIFEQLKKKYGLSDYEEFDKDFEISTIDKEGLFLLEICKRMDEKIDLFAKVIDKILQPDTTIADMREHHAFDDSQKKALFELFKELKILHHSALLLLIDQDERKNAEFIRQVMKQWPSIKKRMNSTAEMLIESWKSDAVSDDELSYMG